MSLHNPHPSRSSMWHYNQTEQIYGRKHDRKDKPLRHSNCACRLFRNTLYTALLGLLLLSCLASLQVLLVLHWLEWKQAVF
jgi:hypothetical protein